MASVSFPFEWSANATTVIVTGTFDNWQKTVTLVKDPNTNKFKSVLDLPRNEKVLYKFIVDGNWTTNSELKTERDESGIENNVIYPEDLAAFSADEQDEHSQKIESHDTTSSTVDHIATESNIAENSPGKEKIVEPFEYEKESEPFRSVELSNKNTRSNSESSFIVSIPSRKKIPLNAEKSNTESSAFTNIETPSQPDLKEAENGLSQVVGEQNTSIVLNSLHLDDLESSASFKSISSNEIFSSTHGTLSHFNMESNENLKQGGSSAIKAPDSPSKEKAGFSLVNKFKRMFK